MDHLKILGSKSRLRILHKLSRRDMYVSEIMDRVPMDGKNCKHHLSSLERAGIVSSRIEGRRKYYTLEKEIRLFISPHPTEDTSFTSWIKKESEAPISLIYGACIFPILLWSTVDVP
ncbi:MAG: winged helix-turn-helix domain-containing protein [Thermoplasmata archaeon]